MVAQLTWLMICLPLAGALLSGLFMRRLGPQLAHRCAIVAVGAALILSTWLFWYFVIAAHSPMTQMVYPWLNDTLYVGILCDPLSMIMSWVVLFVSLLVHVYSIGYMAGDPGYQRFFSLVSFFTFAMLMLVCSPNMLQMFFGWEGVGVASYCLIGFWFKRPTAADGALKAFLVMRVADCGFFIAIAVLYSVYQHLNIVEMIHDTQPLHRYLTLGAYKVEAGTVVAWGLLWGAMGKSAQIPLHLWLPESMEGPTPISALIHAATMVTAGVYLMCRMSFVIITVPQVGTAMLAIGLLGACMMGVVAIIQQDIKRVIAYSTLSQLGLMMAGCGAGLFPLAMFHLFTHASFKALLFLAAGSLIIGMHHEQNLKKMIGCGRSMPITAVCFILGSCSLVALPGFSGFYSKDLLIAGVTYLYGVGSWPHILLIMAAFISVIYIFRVVGLVFMLPGNHQPKEVNWTMTMPMIFLALMSVFQGFFMADWMTSTQALGPWLVMTKQGYTTVSLMQAELKGPIYEHLLISPTFWGTLGLIVLNCRKPYLISDALQKWGKGVVENGFGLEWVYQRIALLWQSVSFLASRCDTAFLDGVFVMGAGRFTNHIAGLFKQRVQIHLYQNIFMMVLGLIILFVMVWWYV